MGPVIRRFGLSQKISTNFANILGNLQGNAHKSTNLPSSLKSYCALILDAIFPEIRSTKFIPDCHSVTKDDRLAHAHSASGQMVKRQTSVEHISVTNLYHILHRRSHPNETAMLDYGRLW